MVSADVGVVQLFVCSVRGMTTSRLPDLLMAVWVFFVQALKMGDLKNLVEIICGHAFIFLSDA